MLDNEKSPPFPLSNIYVYNISCLAALKTFGKS